MSEEMEITSVDILYVGATITNVHLAYQSCRVKSKIRSAILDHRTNIGGILTSTPLKDSDIALDFGPSAFYEQSKHTLALLKALNIAQQALEAENVMMLGDDDTLKKLKEDCPEDGPALTNLSNIEAMVKSHENYEKLDTFAKTLGYMSYGKKMNMESFYNKTKDLGKRFYVPSGIQTLFDKMTDKFNSDIALYFNAPVNQIEFLEKEDRYLVNGRWKAKNIVFSDSFTHLKEICIKTPRLQPIKDALEKLVAGTFSSMTLYLRFMDPWWKKEQVGYKFRGSGSPLGAVTLFSDHIIRIVCDGEHADKMFEQLPEPYLYLFKDQPEWFDPNQTMILKNYLLEHLDVVIKNTADLGTYPDLVSPTHDQLHNIRDVIGQHVPEAFLNFNVMDPVEYTKTFDTLHNHEGDFHVIGGYYDRAHQNYLESSIAAVNLHSTPIFERMSKKDKIKTSASSDYKADDHPSTHDSSSDSDLAFGSDIEHEIQAFDDLDSHSASDSYSSEFDIRSEGDDDSDSSVEPAHSKRRHDNTNTCDCFYCTYVGKEPTKLCDDDCDCDDCKRDPRETHVYEEDVSSDENKENCLIS